MKIINRCRIGAPLSSMVLGILLLLATSASWADGISGPKAEVEGAHYDLLYIIDAGGIDPGAAKALEKALVHIEMSLEVHWEYSEYFGSILLAEDEEAFYQLFKAAKDLEDALEDIDDAGIEAQVLGVLGRIFAAACDLPENLILESTGEYPATTHLEEPLISELMERDQPRQVRKAAREFVRALDQHDNNEIANGINAFMRSWEYALTI